MLELAPEERSLAGVFLAFQYPLEIPGVSNLDFLRVAYNSHRKHRGLEELDAFDFQDLIEEKLDIVKMNDSFLGAVLMRVFPVARKSGMKFCKWRCWNRS